jgi:hypothetical protein
MSKNCCIFFFSLFILGLPLVAEELALPYNHEYQFQYTKSNVAIGVEKFQFEEVTRDNEKAVVLKSTLSLGDATSFQKGESQLVLTAAGKPITFQRSLQVQLSGLGPRNGAYIMTYTFADKGVTVNAQKDGQTILTGYAAELKASLPVLDNNALALFVVMCRQHLKGSVEEKAIPVFHAATLKVMDANFKKVGNEQVKIGEKTYETSKYEVHLDQIPIGFFYITSDGIMVRNFEPRQDLKIDFIE